MRRFRQAVFGTTTGRLVLIEAALIIATVISDTKALTVAALIGFALMLLLGLNWTGYGPGGPGRPGGPARW